MASALPRLSLEIANSNFFIKIFLFLRNYCYFCLLLVYKYMLVYIRTKHNILINRLLRTDMKLLFNLAIVVALFCGVTSCAKSELEIPQQRIAVEFSAQLVDIQTRAENLGKGKCISALYYNIYDAGSNTLLESLSGKSARLADGTFKFSAEMLKGMKYDIVLWAQDSTSTAYTLNGDVITVNYRNADNTGAANANDDSRDAFYKFVDDFDPTSPTAVKRFALVRPFAQLNAAASNIDIAAAQSNGITIESSTIKTKCYTTFNIATGEVANLTNEEIEFTATATPDASGEVLIADYNYLSMNYLLAPADGDTTNVTFIFNTNKNNLVLRNSFYNIPIKANYRTNLLGTLLSKSTEFNVSIDNIWAEEELNENSPL